MTSATPLTYPLEYAFKVIGKNADDFSDYILQAFDAELGPGRAVVAGRTSAQGGYLALTVTVTLRTEAERLAIYGRLHQMDRVKYYL